MNWRPFWLFFVEVLGTESRCQSSGPVGPTDFCRSDGSLWTLAEKGGEAKEEGRNCPIQSGGLSLFFLTPLETSLGDERRYFPTDLAGFFRLLLFGENYVCGDCLFPPYIVCSSGMTSNIEGKGCLSRSWTRSS